MTSLNSSCHYLPGFFQIAYVTNDLERATRIFGDQYGVARFHCMRDIAFDDDTRVSIATAYVGETMVELIEPNGKGTSLYEEVLPAGAEFTIRHHHMGHLVTDKEDWKRIHALIAEKGQAIAYEGGIDGVLKALYVDTRPVLGHFLEYIYCMPAGLEFLNQAPRN